LIDTVVGPDGIYLLHSAVAVVVAVAVAVVVAVVVACVSAVVSDFGGALALDFLDHGLVLIGPAVLAAVSDVAALDGPESGWDSHAALVSNDLDPCSGLGFLADLLAGSALASISPTVVAVIPRFVFAVVYGLVDFVLQVSELYQMSQKKTFLACFLCGTLFDCLPHMCLLSPGSLPHGSWNRWMERLQTKLM
jgi:hypothetical protein